MRAGLEKAKQALEKESADMSADLRSLASAKQDMEHKKKKVEGQLNDLHSRFNESERQRTELGERVSKMSVSHKNKAYMWNGACILIHSVYLLYHKNNNTKKTILARRVFYIKGSL